MECGLCGTLNRDRRPLLRRLRVAARPARARTARPSSTRVCASATSAVRRSTGSRRGRVAATRRRPRRTAATPSARPSPCSSPTSGAPPASVSAPTPRSPARSWPATTRSSRTAIDAHGGTVAKFMGDGMMATFGIPEIAEDDAERAVRAGIDIQDRFERFAADVAARYGETLTAARRRQHRRGRDRRGRRRSRRRRAQRRGPAREGVPARSRARRRRDVAPHAAASSPTRRSAR